MEAVCRGLDLAVVVAVVTARMVQVAIHQIIHMIPVRHRFVPASLPMLVA